MTIAGPSCVFTTIHIRWGKFTQGEQVERRVSGVRRVKWWGVFVLAFCLRFFVGVGGVFLCFWGVEGLNGVVGLVLLV